MQTAEKPSKVRESGLELYRIIVMLLIVAHHYVVNSGLMNCIESSPLSLRSIFLLLFGAWGKTGINCFVLITGYFMCRSQITVSKYCRLLFEVVFYKLLFYFLFLISGYEPFSMVSFIKAIIPITSIDKGFTGCFLAFYLFIPYLNILIRHMNEHMHRMLTILCLFIYTILGTVPKFDVSFNYVSWFAVLYFLASYFRCYPHPIFENKRIWGFVTVVMVLISSASVVMIKWLSIALGMNISPYYFVSDSNRFLAVVTSCAAFLYFKNLNIKYKPWINALGGATFGVLMIHANSDTMRRWLWQDLLKNVGMFDSQWLPVHAIVSVFAVFIICASMDLVRKKYIEKPLFDRWECKPFLRESAD